MKVEEILEPTRDWGYNNPSGWSTSRTMSLPMKVAIATTGKPLNPKAIKLNLVKVEGDVATLKMEVVDENGLELRGVCEGFLVKGDSVTICDLDRLFEIHVS